MVVTPLEFDDIVSDGVGLLAPSLVVLGALHDDQSRQEVEEDEADPAGHPVGPRGPEVPVDDDDGDENREDVHDEGEEEVLGDQRDRDGGRREDLRDEQQEDDQRQEDGDAHRHLLACISRQVEDADAEEGDEDAGDDEVDRVEEGLPTDAQSERDQGLVVPSVLVNLWW